MAGGVISIIFGAIFLLVGVQTYGGVDNLLSCNQAIVPSGSPAHESIFYQVTPAQAVSLPNGFKDGLNNSTFSYSQGDWAIYLGELRSTWVGKDVTKLTFYVGKQLANQNGTFEAAIYDGNFPPHKVYSFGTHSANSIALDPYNGAAPDINLTAVTFTGNHVMATNESIALTYTDPNNVNDANFNNVPAVITEFAAFPTANDTYAYISYYASALQGNFTLPMISTTGGGVESDIVGTFYETTGGGGGNADFTNTCNTAKNVTYILFSILPYGLLIGGLAILFLGVKLG